MSFGKIEFGHSAAEKELAANPDLLLHGFLDERHVIDTLMAGTHNLVLGQKGSGKSAVGIRLVLLAKESNAFRATLVPLGHFPFQAFGGLFHTKEAPETQLPAHWEFLFLTSLVQLFFTDNTALAKEGPSITNAHGALVEARLLPSKNLADMAKTTTKRETRVGIPRVMEHNQIHERGIPDHSLDAFLAALRKTVYSTQGLLNHFLVVDGLDDILTKRDRQHESLLALIEGVNEVNNRLRENEVPATVIVFCRLDLWDRIQGPNKNKIYQDEAITLNWHEDPRIVSNNDLIRLVNIRASRSLGRPVDVFGEFFSGFPRMSKAEDVARLVMMNTRHLPRDMIMAMKRIQEACRGEPPTFEAVLTGLKHHSEDYFIEEIKNELSGLLHREEVDLAIDLLGSIGRKEFLFQDMEAVMRSESRFKSLDLERICIHLFECSAIGNAMHHSEFIRYTFRYRNRHVKFNKHLTIVVHPGLWKGLNILFEN